MARIRGADPSQQGPLSGLFTRIVYWLTKRKLGRVVVPEQIVAHHSRLLWGYGQIEQSLAASRLLDASLKYQTHLRYPSLGGSPFRRDIRSAVSMKRGVSTTQ